VSDEDLLGGLNEKFGTVFKAMTVLFEAISGGNDWSELARELKTIGEVYYVIFALYVVFVALGVLNIVTSLFVDGTMQASASQKDEMLKAAQEKKHAMADMMGDLFQELDSDQSGKLSWEELEEHLSDENLQEYFNVLEIQAEEAKDFFTMLDVENSGEVDIKDFTAGCLRIMGTPNNLDIYTCSLQSKRILDMLENLNIFLKVPQMTSETLTI